MMKTLDERINDTLVKVKTLNESIKMNDEYTKSLKKNLDENILKLNELRLLRDIRDGKLSVFDTKLEQPVVLHYYHDAA